MTQLRMMQHFEAPIERVFELGIDFKRYPEWNTFYSEVSEIKGPPDQIGTKIFDTMKILGKPIEGTTEIVEIEKPRFIKLVGTSPQGGSLKALYKLTPVGMGTDLVVEFEYELPTQFYTLFERPFVEQAVERELRHTLENFKAFVELKTPVLV
jgi:uncharacterized membrane protein